MWRGSGRLATCAGEARAFASSPPDIARAENTNSPVEGLAIMAGATDGVPTKAKLPIWAFERACVTILLSDGVRRTSALPISAGPGASRPERLLAAQSGRMLPPARRSGASWTRSICSSTLVRKTSHEEGELDLCSSGNEALTTRGWVLQSTPFAGRGGLAVYGPVTSRTRGRPFAPQKWASTSCRRAMISALGDRVRSTIPIWRVTCGSPKGRLIRPTPSGSSSAT